MINSNSVLTLARGLFISDVEAYMLGDIFVGYSYSGEFLRGSIFADRRSLKLWISLQMNNLCNKANIYTSAYQYMLHTD